MTPAQQADVSEPLTALQMLALLLTCNWAAGRIRRRRTRRPAPSWARR